MAHFLRSICVVDSLLLKGCSNIFKYVIIMEIKHLTFDPFVNSSILQATSILLILKFRLYSAFPSVFFLKKEL